MALADLRERLVESGCSEAMAERVLQEGIDWCVERLQAGDAVDELDGLAGAPFQGDALRDLLEGVVGAEGDPSLWPRIIAAPSAEASLMAGILTRGRCGDWAPLHEVLEGPVRSMEDRLLLELVARVVVELWSDNRPVPGEVLEALPGAVARIEEGPGPVGLRCGVLGSEAWWSLVRAAVGDWPDTLAPLEGQKEPELRQRLRRMVGRHRRRVRRDLGMFERDPLEGSTIAVAHRWFWLAEQRPDPERPARCPRWLEHRLLEGGDLGAPCSCLEQAVYWARLSFHIDDGDLARLQQSVGWRAIDEAMERPTETGSFVGPAPAALRRHLKAGWTLPSLRMVARARLGIFCERPSLMEEVSDATWFVWMVRDPAGPRPELEDLYRRRVGKVLPFVLDQAGPRRRDPLRPRRGDEDDRADIWGHVGWPAAWSWLAGLSLEGRWEEERRRLLGRMVRERVPGWRSTPALS